MMDSRAAARIARSAAANPSGKTGKSGFAQRALASAARNETTASKMNFWRSFTFLILIVIICLYFYKFLVNSLYDFLLSLK